METYTVYEVFCIPTGKCYIGCTSKTLKERLQKHLWDATDRSKNGAKRGAPELEFHKDLLKYGTSQCKAKVLHTGLSKKDGYAKEIAEIAAHNSFTPNGYNSTKGGVGNLGHLWAKSSENIEKFRNLQKIRWANTFGADRMSSEDTRKAQSEAKKNSHVKAQPIIFRGIEYKSFRQAEAATGASIYVIKKEIAGEPVTAYGARPKPYKVKDRVFDSREQAAEFYGVSIHNLASYIARNIDHL